MNKFCHFFPFCWRKPIAIINSAGWPYKEYCGKCLEEWKRDKELIKLFANGKDYVLDKDL